MIYGSDPFAEMLIINYRNVTPATGIENIDKEQTAGSDHFAEMLIINCGNITHAIEIRNR